MRPPGGDGKLAEHRDVDVGVPAGDVFPMRIVQSLGSEGGAEFEQGVRGAHFLESDDVRVDGAQAFANLRPGFSGLQRAGAGWFINVVLHVIRGDAEGFCGGQQGCTRQEQGAGLNENDQAA